MMTVVILVLLTLSIVSWCSMVHLTLTGYRSQRSRTLCDIDPSLLNSNDKHYHASYCSDKLLQRERIYVESVNRYGLMLVRSNVYSP